MNSGLSALFIGLHILSTVTRSTGIYISFRDSEVPLECSWMEGHRSVVSGIPDPSEQPEYPWLVSLSNSGGHFCQGILIGPKMVLTAASCFFEANPLHNVGADTERCKIVFGVTAQNQNGTVRHRISHVFRNQWFAHSNDMLLRHDTAIAFLEKPMEHTETTVCLQNGILPTDGSKCWAIGKRSEDENKMVVRNVTVEQCAIPEQGREQEYYDRLRLCALKSAFKGDAGGPVLCKHAGRYYLAGVMSQSSSFTEKTILTNMLTGSHGGDWLIKVLNFSERMWKQECPFLSRRHNERK